MTHAIAKNDDFLEPVITVAKSSRMDHDAKGTLWTSGSAGGIIGMLAIAGHAPLDLALGIGAAFGGATLYLQNFASLKCNASDYLEMISPRRKEVTVKEVLRAWAFLPGKGTTRTVDTFYVNWDKGAEVKRLKNGLACVSQTVKETEASHKITNKVKSSWHGLEIVQTIEPLDGYRWEQALDDVMELYGVELPEQPLAVAASSAGRKTRAKHMVYRVKKTA